MISLNKPNNPNWVLIILFTYKFLRGILRPMLTLLVPYFLWFWSHKELLSASKILHKNVSCICYAQMVWTSWARPGSGARCSELSPARAGPGESRSPLSGFPFSSEPGQAARARSADRLPASQIWRVERKTILRQKVYCPESYPNNKMIRVLEDPSAGGEWMIQTIKYVP